MSGSLPGAGAAARAEGEAAPPFRLLLVCTGNTCRSPMAEAIVRQELARRGWSRVQVASAGLSAAAGEPATPQAVSVAARAGVDLSAHRSRRLTPAIAAEADLILGMGAAHVAALARLGAGEKAVTLGDFAAGPGAHGPPVPDPFGAGEAVYAATFRELQALLGAALDRLAPLLAE